MKSLFRNAASVTLSRGMTLSLLLIIFFMAPVLAEAAPANQKTGVMDVSKVIEQMPETKAAENKLKALSSQWENALNNLKKDFQSAVSSYEQKKASLSKDARAQKEKELNLKYQQVQKYQIEKFGPNGAFDKKKSELFLPIREKVLAAAKAVANQKGFSVIIDKQAMIYADDSADITYQVISKLK